MNGSLCKEPCEDYEKGTSFTNCLVDFVNKNSSCKVMRKQIKLVKKVIQGADLD